MIHTLNNNIFSALSKCNAYRVVDSCKVRAAPGEVDPTADISLPLPLNPLVYGFEPQIAFIATRLIDDMCPCERIGGEGGVDRGEGGGEGEGRVGGVKEVATKTHGFALSLSEALPFIVTPPLPMKSINIS